MAAAGILHFLDNLAANRARRDMVLSAAVSSGVITAVQAWPEYFEGMTDDGDPVFPSTDADMAGFELEDASPESFAEDIKAMVAAKSEVTVREEAEPGFPGLPYGLPDTEWT